MTHVADLFKGISLMKTKGNVEYQFNFQEIDDVPWPYWHKNKSSEFVDSSS